MFGFLANLFLSILSLLSIMILVFESLPLLGPETKAEWKLSTWGMALTTVTIVLFYIKSVILPGI